MPAAVIFAFGNRPGIDASEGRELAQVLFARRTLAAAQAGMKIQAAAEVDFPREQSKDVILDRSELEELAAVLAEERVEGDSPAVARLRREVTAELEREDDA